MCDDLSFINTAQKTLKPSIKIFRFPRWMRKNFTLRNFNGGVSAETRVQQSVPNTCDILPLKEIFLQNLNLVSAIFSQIFIFYHMIALQKLENVFLFHLKSSFRSQDIQIFVIPSSPLFLPISHCFTGSSKKNLKAYDIINCLNKNLITHFV